MIDRRTLALAYLLDWAVGDPEWFPHPVRLIGKAITNGERILLGFGQSPRYELLAGGALTLSLVATSYAGTAKPIKWAARCSPWLGFAAELALAWTCLASRSLHNEASAVIAALEDDDIGLARHRLARIVGRDTDDLDIEEICRAVIETVAESTSDGVIAPLLYLAIGGVPLAMAYKAVNTLDSMIGHTSQRHFYFGKIAARLDDAANLLPARLTALGIAASAFVFEHANSASAITIWLRDGDKHKSPNAGQSESAMAGALQVRLGGTNLYDGEPIAASLIGAEFPPPSTRQAKQAIRIAAAVSIIGVFAALLFVRRRR